MRVRQAAKCNKNSSQDAPKLCHFELKNIQWEGDTPPHPGASFLALAMIRPPLFYF